MIVVVGSINMDTVLEVDALPRPGETVTARTSSYAHGGKGANQAVAAARLEAEVEFIGTVGSDAFGAELLGALSDEGVGVGHVGRVDGASGMAVVMVDRQGENSIVVSPGANRKVELDGSDRELLGRASIVLVQLEIPIAVVEEAARAAGGMVVLNAAPAAPIPKQLADVVDVLVVNRQELRSIAGDATPAAARSTGVDTVIVTLGAEGAQVVAAGDLATYRPPAITVADTTGAGDTFCGALASGLDRGLDVFEATAEAVVAGALATTGLGARTAMPTLPRLTRAMGEYL